MTAARRSQRFTPQNNGRARNTACLLSLCLALLVIPLSAQEDPVLSESLVDQRIAALGEPESPDSQATLQTYQAVKTWLSKAASFASEAERYAAELNEAPLRVAEIQKRLDAAAIDPPVLEGLDTLSLVELKDRLALVQSQIFDANASLEALDRQLAARESKAESIRTRLSEIAARQTAIPGSTAGINPDAPPSNTEASTWLQQAELMSLHQERLAQTARLDSQPVRFSALAAERTELKLTIDALMRNAERLTAQMLLESQTSSMPVPLDIDPQSPAYELALRYQQENLALDEERQALERHLAETSSQREALESANRLIDERFARARRVVDFAGRSESIGEALLAYRQEVDTLRMDKPREGIPRLIGDVVIKRIRQEELLEAMASLPNFLHSDLIGEGLDPDTVKTSDLDILLEQLSSKREMLRNIIVVESTYIDTLNALEAEHVQHEASLGEYKRYLAPLLLWIPSSAPLWEKDFSLIPGELAALPTLLSSVAIELKPAFFIGLLSALILLLMRTKLRDRQHARNSQIVRPREDSINYTVEALALSALRAAPAALVIAALASLFPVDQGTAVAALHITLVNLAKSLFALTLLQTLLEEGGVARNHCGWNEPLCDRLEGETRWFIRTLLPVIAVTGLLYRVDNTAALTGRLAMLGAIALLAIHFTLELRQQIQRQGRGVLSMNENRIRLLLVGVFIALFVSVVFGFRYTVGIVSGTLMEMLQAGIMLTIVRSFFLRWLQVTRKRLRFAELVAARHSRDEQSGSELLSVEADQSRLADIGEETRQLVDAASIIGALLVMYDLWSPLLPFFDAMAGLTLWSSTSMVEGEPVIYRITMDAMLFVVLLLSVTFYAARKLPALVELVLRSRTDVSAGARYTTSTLLNYVILGSGILVALSTLGLDWSKLQWLVAAMGVGIGFGLQEIVANFISGLIILFERPISVGDVITVGDQDGVVTRIRIRATTIRDWDNKELLVPNKEIITGRLLNWSLSDTRLRIIVPVGVAYGSDVTMALQILNQVAADDPRILNEPAPSIIFSGFGDNSLDLVCRCYIDSIDHLWPVKTGIHLEIYRRFAEAGIVIAFPQRDVHLDSEHPLRIAIEPPAGTNGG